MSDPAPRPVFGSVTARLRTFVVLLVLALVLVIAAVWGWRAMTKPLPGKADASVCENTKVAAGSKVYPAQVVVTVLNASTRGGLAARTMASLTDEGFVAGVTGDAPKNAEVKRVQVWASDLHNPAVKLVASWLHDPTMVKRKTTQPGVVVVVGHGFPRVSGGKKAVKAAETTTICSPNPD
ncbi:MAG: LytR C-terminal domain-containing protein [Nocardioides sp.]|uniref:LytR C-terminal domain-containing protein n=1 Tax=Nocardioides sp. TaxID=35761 RepID=UPI0039E2E81B